VAKFRFSRRAEFDLLEVGRYTLHRWGAFQTDIYLQKLVSCCQRLTVNPYLGRTCDDVRPTLRRMEQGKHVIFCIEEPGGILIFRILHRRMLPGNYSDDDEDEPSF
jgi:toxin ParE1/3/4